MEKVVIAASLAVLLAGTPAVAQEMKKGMDMKDEKMHDRMHEKMKDRMKDKMKDKQAGAKNDAPAKKDEHKH